VILYKGNWKVEAINAEDNFKQNKAKITQEEKDRLNKKKTNLLISWDWSYTREKSELQAYYENRMKKRFCN
jgi:hypothetical protein